MKHFYLPEPLVTGSETLPDPENSAVSAIGTLTVNPICQEKRDP